MPTTVNGTPTSGFATNHYLGAVSPGVLNGPVRRARSVSEIATTSLDEIGDIVTLLRIEPNIRPHSLKVWSDNLDGNNVLRLHFGLYKVNIDESLTVLDADCFAASLAAGPIAGGTTGGLDILNHTLNIDNRGVELWDMAAGVTANPNVPLEICFTVATAATAAAAGTLVIELEYTQS